MRAFPIIPTSLMIIICIVLIIMTIKSPKKWQHIIMIILLFLVNQRYMIPSKDSTTNSNNFDVLFVIDNTISMNAEDYNGKEKRIDGVKKDCINIIEKLNGARFGIITFDNKSRILIPFTKDSNMAKETIDIIEPIGEWYARGSSLNTPFEDIEKTLQNAQKKNPDRIRIIFFISDGEITDDSTLKSFKPLRQYINDGAILGYGTKQGGKMHYTDPYSNTLKQKTIMDKTNYPYKEAISVIDEKNLMKIANNLKIDYINMNNGDKINKILNQIEKEMKNDTTSSSITSYEDTYFLLTPIILLLLAIELKEIRREYS